MFSNHQRRALSRARAGCRSHLPKPRLVLRYARSARVQHRIAGQAARWKRPHLRTETRQGKQVCKRMSHQRQQIVLGNCDAKDVGRLGTRLLPNEEVHPRPASQPRANRRGCSALPLQRAVPGNRRGASTREGGRRINCHHNSRLGRWVCLYHNQQSA